jgi:hypothetical protein
MNWDAWKPLATLIFTSLLKFVGGLLVAHGLATNGPGLEALGGAATTAAGALWSWWVQKGHLAAADYLKKLTDTATTAAAVAVAKQMAPAAVTGAAQEAHQEVAGAKSNDQWVKITDAQKTVPVALLAILILGGLFAFTGDARAQGLPKPRINLPFDPAGLNTKPPLITGNVEKDLQGLWDKIVASSIADLNYAAAMAKNANTQTSGIRLQCINAIIALNQQASGANLKNADGTPMVKPDPHVFTDVESLAEVVDNLSPQGPLFVNCAGAAQLAKTNVLTFVNAVVTGAAGFAAMPIIPGL